MVEKSEKAASERTERGKRGSERAKKTDASAMKELKCDCSGWLL